MWGRCKSVHGLDSHPMFPQWSCCWQSWLVIGWCESNWDGGSFSHSCFHFFLITFTSFFIPIEPSGASTKSGYNNILPRNPTSQSPLLSPLPKIYLLKPNLWVQWLNHKVFDKFNYKIVIKYRNIVPKTVSWAVWESVWDLQSS